MTLQGRRHLVPGLSILTLTWFLSLTFPVSSHGHTGWGTPTSLAAKDARAALRTARGMSSGHRFQSTQHSNSSFASAAGPALTSNSAVMLTPPKQTFQYQSQLLERYKRTASLSDDETRELVNVASGNSSCSSVVAVDDALSVDEGMSREMIVITTLLTIFSVTGCIGNAVAFYIYNQRRPKNASVVFILALAGTDFITCLVIIPSVIVFEVLQGRFMVSAACSIFLFFKTSNIPFSAYIMVAIAVDRYLCICHPLVRILNVRRAKIIVAFLALVAFTFGILTAINFGLPSPQVDFAVNETLERNSSGGGIRSDCLPCVPNCTTRPMRDEDVVIFHPETSSVRCCSKNNSFLRGKSSNSVGDVDHMTCQSNGLFPDHVLVIYAKVYASSFLVSFCLMVILYAMTYRSILSHRAKKAKRRKTSARNQRSRTDHSRHGDSDPTTNDRMSRHQSEEHHVNLYANIKTAAMLSVVAIVFIVAYLPAWMMTDVIALLPYNVIAYNMYFVYNVANPFIYAFMNKCFRRDLRKILQICRRRR